MRFASCNEQAQRQPQHATSPAAEYPFGFKAYGVFRRKIQGRNYQPVVELQAAATATDAVGLSGLRGEVSMIEGKLIVSYGLDCGGNCLDRKRERDIAGARVGATLALNCDRERS